MENPKRSPNPLHTWLIMLKSWQSIGRYLRPAMSAEGLGESDFRVLEVLLHKGPMPVNAIGPKVDLNPGSVSVAVDRLHKKAFVSRAECSSDRRIRTVALTEKGGKCSSLSFADTPHSSNARFRTSLLKSYNNLKRC
jgi:MarR family transcriptional regulator, 2-MHQ and catechol-resistance regulon repressor